MRKRGDYALQRHMLAFNAWRDDWSERWMLAAREHMDRRSVHGRIDRLAHDCKRFWQRKPNKYGMSLIVNRIKKEFNTIKGDK